MKEKTFWILQVIFLLLITNACTNQASNNLQPLSKKESESPQTATAEPTLLPTEAPTATSAASSNPKVFSVSPEQDEFLDVNGSILITFSRSMNRIKTEKAWSFYSSDGEEIEGMITWSGFSKMTFEPYKTLDISAKYVAVLGNDAVDQNGNPLLEEFKRTFSTAGSFHLVDVIPAKNSNDVDIDSDITVIFNKPVVPIQILEEQQNAGIPIEISPVTPGKGKWVNSSMYVFQPDEPLHSNTQYEITVPADLENSIGETLEVAPKWYFTTEAVHIESIVLGDGRSFFQNNLHLRNLLLDETIQITFSDAMNIKSVAENLSVVDIVGGHEHPVQISWEHTNRTMTIIPKEPYTIATKYNLILDETAQDQGGGQLEEGLLFWLYTLPLPKINLFDPHNHELVKGYQSIFSIKFNTYIRHENAGDFIKISPEPEEEVEWYYLEDYRELYAHFLEPSTSYEITVLPGIEDIYGNVIAEESSVTFEVDDLSSTAYFLLPSYPLIYREDGEQEVYIQYRNTDEVTVDLFSLPKEKFLGVISQKTDDDDNSLFENQIETWESTKEPPQNELVTQKIEYNDKVGENLAPGFYYLGLNAEPLDYSKRFYNTGLFVVATDNITLKTTETEALVWVTDIDTGVPSARMTVQIYNYGLDLLGTVETDENGIAYLNNIDSPYYVILNEPGHTAITAEGWGSSVYPGDFGIWANYYEDVSGLYSYVYTDRPLYRPGQDVEFKGIVRFEDDLDYSIPYQRSVNVEIIHMGETIFTETMSLNRYGTFSGTFTLVDESSLGNYSIIVYEVNSAGESQKEIGYVTFNVAEYQKPEFEVAIDSDFEEVLIGDEINFSVNAAYYSGGYVANPEVSWKLDASVFRFYPSKDYQRFNFYDYHDYPSERLTITNGTDQADASGHLDLPITVTDEDFSGSHTIELQANVVDNAGNLVASRRNAIVHQSQYYAGIDALQYITKVNEGGQFDLVVLDWDSTPVPEQDVKVEIYKRTWHSVQEKDSSGTLRWVSSVEDNLVYETNAITGQNGETQVYYTPAEGGGYRAVVIVEDEFGNSHQAGINFWVSSHSYVSWRHTNDATFDLIVDQESYTPGDTAKILIAQPFEDPVYALVTTERGHIQTSEVIYLESNSTIYELPITAEMAPKVYVSVVVLQGADYAETGSEFKMGMTEILVDTSQQELQVDISTDVPEAGPGGEVTYTVQVTDTAGNPVQAEVSFALIDKAVLALANSNSGEIVSSFYPVKKLSVRTASGTVLSAEKYNENYEGSDLDGDNMGGGAKGSGLLGILDIRENFKDTAYFEAQVTTNQDGVASVTVTLPENLTSWQMDVRAVTMDTRVGQNTHDLISTKPLFVTLQSPSFFIVDDQAQIGALVHNMTDKTLDVQMNLIATGVTLDTEATQVVEIEAGSQKYVTWKVTVPDDSERVDFIVQVESGEYQDSSKPAAGNLDGRGIPVYQYVVQEPVGSSGMLDDAESVTENVQMPTSFDITNAEIIVETSPSLAGGITNGIDYLKIYPYHCMEQTTSRLFANVINARLLALSGKSDPKMEKDLGENINAALQKLYAKQNPDGGWGYWYGESSPYLTAYVLDGMLSTRDAGYQVSDEAIEDGLHYISYHVGYLQRSSKRYVFNQQAYVLYVQAKAGVVFPSNLSRLFENRDRQSLFGKAFLMQAIEMSDLDHSYVDTLMKDILSDAITYVAGQHWEEIYEDYWSWNTDTRSTAIILNSLIQVDPTYSQIPSIVRWLMSNRTNGRWFSTQETMWTLLALTNWLEYSKELEGDFPYSVSVDGEEIYIGDVNATNILSSVQTFYQVEDVERGQILPLEIQRSEGPGNLYYSTFANYSLPVTEIEAIKNGIFISRQYYDAEDLDTPITEIQQGGIVQVRITIVVPKSVFYLVIDDPLPAGLQAIDTALLTSPDVPVDFTYEDISEFGWGWWYFDYEQMYDEKVVISADYLPAGTYVYTYYARAATPGIYNVIPITGQQFYSPDVYGRGDGSIFSIYAPEDD